jgi:hypothetical protein
MCWPVVDEEVLRGATECGKHVEVAAASVTVEKDPIIAPTLERQRGVAIVVRRALSHIAVHTRTLD